MSQKESAESNARQEAIIDVLDKLGSNNHKACRALFGVCASESLTAPELLDEDLKGHAKNSTKKSK